MALRFFQLLDKINHRLDLLERADNEINRKIDYLNNLNKTFLLRIKNHENFNDEMIIFNRVYNDLTPDKAYAFCQNQDKAFVFIDVSDKDMVAPDYIEGLIHIPLNELESKIANHASANLPILVISNDGTKSILACEKLVKIGYFNISNVSGGYTYWPKANKIAI